MLYTIIFVLGSIIRKFVLPNPFTSLGDKAEFINLIANFIIPAIAFASVELFYRKGSFPAFGSACFTLFYAAIVGLIWLAGLFHFKWWAVIAFLIVYIIFVFVVKEVIERIRIHLITRR